MVFNPKPFVTNVLFSFSIQCVIRLVLVLIELLGLRVVIQEQQHNIHSAFTQIRKDVALKNEIVIKIGI